MGAETDMERILYQTQRSLFDIIVQTHIHIALSDVGIFTPYTQAVQSLPFQIQHHK
jgi:hypothetical protein